MTALGIEIQNRCEAIKQNYTSIFDDGEQFFWVSVPLIVISAATAHTSLLPLMFVAGMFFLGLLTCRVNEVETESANYAFDLSDLERSLTWFEADCAKARTEIYQRCLLDMYAETLDVAPDTRLVGNGFSSYRLYCNVNGKPVYDDTFVVVVHTPEAYSELLHSELFEDAMTNLVIIHKDRRGHGFDFSDPENQAEFHILHRDRTWLFGSSLAFLASKQAATLQSQLLETALKGA